MWGAGGAPPFVNIIAPSGPEECVIDVCIAYHSNVMASHVGRRRRLITHESNFRYIRRGYAHNINNK